MLKKLYHSINTSLYAEWIARISVTANFIVLIFVNLNNVGETYLDTIIGLTVLGLWFYFFKSKLAAIVFFLIALWIHYAVGIPAIFLN